MRRHEAGLDGLRGLSIAVVLAYHGEVPAAKGGFLGISLFFTLSGFLITSILLRTHERSGTIGLRAFWGRRYRRLLPAAYLALALVVVFGATAATRQQLADLPGAVLAATAVVSTLLMTVLYDHGASFDRLYYGTDTRAAELLVGCVLAVVLQWRPLRLPTRNTRRVWGAAGVLALVAAAWAWSHVDLTDTRLWRGGFLAFSLLGAVLIVTVLHHAGPVAGLGRPRRPPRVRSRRGSARTTPRRALGCRCGPGHCSERPPSRRAGRLGRRHNWGCSIPATAPWRPTAASCRT